MTLTRREFMKSSFAGASLVLLAPRLRGDLQAPVRTLVIVQLIGGNDTLNTFIPYTSPQYRAARPNLGIPDRQILQADSRIGFHPSMTELRDLYQQGKFTFVTNVGFPTLDRSHFRCQDVWHTASESPGTESRGWLGRWADLYAPDTYSPVCDIGVASSTPRGIGAGRVLPTCLTDLQSFHVEGIPANRPESDWFESSLRLNYRHGRADDTVELVRHTGDMAFSAIDLLHALPPPSALVDYRNDGHDPSALSLALQMSAQIIASGFGCEVIWVSLSGFDTHCNQADAPGNGSSITGTHARLLRDVSFSLASFQRDIEFRGVADRVLVMAWTEFGRRVQENASFGTDHGKAGSAMLLGRAVKGGEWYGEEYDLTNLDEGDLKTNIDFRSVYATVIHGWLGGDPALVLGKSYEQLGFLETSGRQRAVRR